jgi:hypothetical protein
MKQPTYREAVEYLALNVDVNESKARRIATLLTTVLVADLWGVSPARVARDIVQLRRAYGI